MLRTLLPCLLLLISLILVSCEPAPTPKEPVTTDKQPTVQPGEPPVIVGEEPAAKDEPTEKPTGDLPDLPTPTEARPDLVAEVLAGNRPAASAAWWGFAPKDSTATLQAAIDSGAGEIVIPRMPSPWVVGPIRLSSNQAIRIHPGTEILAKQGAYRSNAACLFEARNVENLKILGGKDVVLRMNRDEYGHTGQWRHTLSLRGCSNVEVRDMTLLDSGGDGVYVGTGIGEGAKNYCKDVVLAGLVSKNHYRQGISVISAENLLIDQCILSNIHGCKGAAFGLDIEPNSPAERLVNVVVRDTQMGPNPGTAGMGVSLTRFDKTTRPVSIHFEGCTVRGGRERTSALLAKCRPGLRGRLVLSGCDITSFAVLNKAVTGPKVVIRNTSFRRPEGWPDNVGVIRFIVKKRDGMSTACGGARFENCTVYSKDDLIVSHQVINLDPGEASFAEIEGTLKVDSVAEPRIDLPGVTSLKARPDQPPRQR